MTFAVQDLAFRRAKPRGADVPSVARWKKQMRSDPELRAKFELFLALRQDRDVRRVFYDWVALTTLVEQTHLERGSRRTNRSGPPVPELPTRTPTPDEAQDLPLVDELKCSAS